MSVLRVGRSESTDSGTSSGQCRHSSAEESSDPGSGRRLKELLCPNTHTHTHNHKHAVTVPLCLFSNTPPSFVGANRQNQPSRWKSLPDCIIWLMCVMVTRPSWRKILFLSFIRHSHLRHAGGSSGTRRRGVRSVFSFFLVRNEPPFRRRGRSRHQPDEYSRQRQRAALHKTKMKPISSHRG